MRARPAHDDASSIVAWNLPPHLFAAVARSRPRPRGGLTHRLDFGRISARAIGGTAEGSTHPPIGHQKAAQVWRLATARISASRPPRSS